MGSPAERFRNELSWRLCAEGNLSLPSANILLGVIIDGMEYNLSSQHRPLAHTTLHNVLKVSQEIECLGRILGLKIRSTYKSTQSIPSLTLQTLRSLSLPPNALLTPNPKTTTYLTYIAIVHHLSAYIGPNAVHELIKDFNWTAPKKGGRVRKVPGIGPRVVKKGEALGPVRSRKSSLRIRDREKLFGPWPAVPVANTPKRSMERGVKPVRSMDRLVNAHPVVAAMGPTPFSHSKRNEPRDRPPPPVSFRPPREPRHTASQETLRLGPVPVKPHLRSTRSQDTFAPAAGPPVSLSLPTRTKSSPYHSVSEPGTPNPGVQTPSSTLSFKRRSIRSFEYILNKLGRISRIHSSESSIP
ncbi:hypothetical protein RSOLAG22IIIB_08737 [Rhizoctonia solani]|uniref:Uncharacterized protein n=1 Tax=Rhizoctonia solani TaxID=456999 RepID=A0A0K6FUQ9_9AGAM|nr:hypothetical protein RSOLAG22IIIB_08737 [Rhizoctonia solani]